MFFKENLSSIVLKKMKLTTCINEIQKVFAYKFKNNCKLYTEKEIEDGWKIYDVYEEYIKRQNISKVFWKITDLNDKFEICSTYPKKLVVSAFAPSLVTVLPPVLVSGFILLILYFIESD